MMQQTVPVEGIISRTMHEVVVVVVPCIKKTQFFQVRLQTQFNQVLQPTQRLVNGG